MSLGLARDTSRKGRSDAMGCASTGAASWGGFFFRCLVFFVVVAVAAVGCTSRGAGDYATPLSPAIVGGSGVGWILWILSVVVVVGISVARRASAPVVAAVGAGTHLDVGRNRDR